MAREFQIKVPWPFLRFRWAPIILLQLGLIALSYGASFTLRLDLDVGEVPWEFVLRTLPLVIAVRLVGLIVFRLYRGMWRYVSVVDLVQIIKASTASTILFLVLEVLIFGLEEFPRSVFLIDWAGNIFLLSGVRLSIRLLRERFHPMRGARLSSTRLLILGAGDAGAALCRQAIDSRAFAFEPVAFLDDDPRKAGTSIMGVPVVGRCDDLPRVSIDHSIDLAVIAMPSASPSEKHSLVDLCQRAEVPFKILPSTSDLLDRTISINHIREVDPSDLLGRPMAKLDSDAIKDLIRNKRVLVTGAAGSVGSELARQIAALQPRSLFLLDHAENPLLFLESELRGNFSGISLAAEVGDITDEPALRRLVEREQPQLIFHAAAHKHVPLMERTPGQAIKNNVGGTYVVARCAQAVGVEVFVLVSTDKAVKPTSVMGATKRLAELLVRSLNDQGPTRFVAVRFGNVLGSNASVIPIFNQQISNGGPVTVTHREADRYFMSIPEAAGLILQAGAIGAGGEIFVLDMGEPVKITSLAELLITLSGLTPYEEIDIVYTGLRPGEKLSEELRFDDEELEPTSYDKLLVLNRSEAHPGVISSIEELLSDLPRLEAAEVKRRLAVLVPEYRHGETEKAAL